MYQIYFFNYFFDKNQVSDNFFKLKTVKLSKTEWNFYITVHIPLLLSCLVLLSKPSTARPMSSVVDQFNSTFVNRPSNISLPVMTRGKNGAIKFVTWLPGRNGSTETWILSYLAHPYTPTPPKLTMVKLHPASWLACKLGWKRPAWRIRGNTISLKCLQCIKPTFCRLACLDKWNSLLLYYKVVLKKLKQCVKECIEI